MDNGQKQVAELKIELKNSGAKATGTKEKLIESTLADAAPRDRPGIMVKMAFLLAHPDVDMLRCKELNSFATECIIPRRPKRGLPPLPEDKECSNLELKKCIKLSNKKRKHRGQCLILPALPEYDEC